MANDIDIEFTRKIEDVTRRLSDAVLDGTKKSMLRAAQLAAGALAREAPKDRGKLQQDYANSATLLAPKDGKLRAGALSDLVYARIQDEGGTITPVRAKALAIPISQMAKRLRSVGPRQFPKSLSLVWPRGREGGWLMERTRSGRSIAHYALRKSVRLDGSDYIAAARRRAVPLIKEAIGEGIASQVAKA